MKERATLILLARWPQFFQRIAFTRRLRQVQRAIEPDIFRNGRVDQRVEVLEADRLQHLRYRRLIRPDVPARESIVLVEETRFLLHL